jgi:hypothetical protein
MSGMNPKANLRKQPDLPEDYKYTQQAMDAAKHQQRSEGEFSVRLGKPDLYNVSWDTTTGPMKSKGTAWSSGAGDFIYTNMRGKPRYVKMQNRDMALGMANGLSSGAAGTLPAIFFKTQQNVLDTLKMGLTRQADESIAGDDCYVLSGNMMGMEFFIWINKATHLFKQTRILMGGAPINSGFNERQIKEAIKKANPKMSEAQIAQSVQNAAQMASRMKGSMTQTYNSIEINKPVSPADFKFDVPAGTPLSNSLY